MNKIRMIMLGVAMLLAFPLASQAAMLNMQGVMTKAVAQVTTNSGGTVSTQTMMETNASRTPNMSMAFDNVSGIVHRGSIVFGDTGMWIGFGGTALAPTPTMFLGNMQGGGVMRMSGDVTYNMSTNTYTGSGTVVEFAGTVALSGMMKSGWTGMFGTPGAGFPGGGWMPAWGGGTGQGGMMPGWGGMMSGWTGGTPGWGMMSATSMMPGTGGGMMPGTGSTTPTTGGTTMPIFGGTTTVSGGTTTGGTTIGGMMPGTGGTTTPGSGLGMMPGSGAGTIGVGGQAGMARMWVNPTTAAMITVTNGVPDHANPVAVHLGIVMPGTRMMVAP